MTRASACKDSPASGANGLVVHANVLRRLNLRSQLADDFASDADTAGGDQLIAMPPRADAGMGQDFVEAFHAAIVADIADSFMRRALRGAHASARRALPPWFASQ